MPTMHRHSDPQSCLPLCQSSADLDATRNSSNDSEKSANFNPYRALNQRPGMQRTTRYDVLIEAERRTFVGIVGHQKPHAVAIHPTADVLRTVGEHSHAVACRSRAATPR